MAGWYSQLKSVKVPKAMNKSYVYSVNIPILGCYV